MSDVIKPQSMVFDRRSFLGGVAVASSPAFYAPSSSAANIQQAQDAKSKAEAAFPGVISRQKDPLNAEFPFPTLNSFLTPNEQFYIRNHFPVPKVEIDRWKLKVEGHVSNPFEVSYEELRDLGPQKQTCLMECSGNSRVFLKPPQLGIRWEQGAVGNAEWTGVPLAALLERAGVREGAKEVILEGSDKGSLDEPDSKTPGEISYARGIPLDKALRPEVLLAYQMKGEDLTPDHGYPVRAVVAGWYGMASVKWIKRIIITDRPFHGFFQTFMSSVWERDLAGQPSLKPVTEIAVKSQIARPMLHERIPAGSRYRIFGAAWAGEAKIEEAKISVDGGATWSSADLDNKSLPFCWRFFSFEWKVPARAGKHTLMARATDDRGVTQPLDRDDDRRDAVITHV